MVQFLSNAMHDLFNHFIHINNIIKMKEEINVFMLIKLYNKKIINIILKDDK